MTPEEEELLYRFQVAKRLRNEKFARLQDELRRRTPDPAATQKQAELDAYRAERIAAAEEPMPQRGYFGILPEFIDLIHGDSREEVDQSVALMVEKTASVVRAVQAAQS